MNILLFGPPGSGKGTQSSLFVKKTNKKHISPGNLFREAVKDKTELGLQIESYMDKGHLVPDKVTIDLIKGVLTKSINQKQNFILDGFPRTIEQAKALKNQLNQMKTSLDKVFFLDVSDDLLIERLSGRRTCGNCGKNYHIKNHPPKKIGICDICQKKLVQRKDDKTEVVKKRLQVYKEMTNPLKQFYSDDGILVLIDGNAEIETIFKNIQEHLKNKSVSTKTLL